MGSSDNPNHRYLSLTGVVAHLGHYRSVIDPGMMALKTEVFGSTSVVLHRRDILDRNPPFECLEDSVTEYQFNEGLISGLTAWEFEIITVVIDKKKHREKYRTWHFHPYHYCMVCLLERYIKSLMRKNAFGDVMAESRNRRDDAQLARSYRVFRDRGSSYVKSRALLNRLSSVELKLKKKTANINGLQIADLVASPSFRSMLCEKTGEVMTAPFGRRIVDVLEGGKYDTAGTGYLWGNGKKWLP